jgi:hypothetical protein
MVESGARVSSEVRNARAAGACREGTMNRSASSTSPAAHSPDTANDEDNDGTSKDFVVVVVAALPAPSVVVAVVLITAAAGKAPKYKKCKRARKESGRQPSTFTTCPWVVSLVSCVMLVASTKEGTSKSTLRWALAYSTRGGGKAPGKRIFGGGVEGTDG